MKKQQTGPDDAGATFRPFESLKDLLNERAVTSGPEVSRRRSSAPPMRRPAAPKSEQQLFHDAMADVTPIDAANRHDAPPASPRRPRPRQAKTCDMRVLGHLRRLVDAGHGFEVSQTPEYMEGRGYNVRRDVTRRLYSGDFSIQDHIDLHGLTAAEAREAFFSFMESAISNGHRAVLVVHGRGLSSPVRPVLKGKVLHWLTRSPIRKWVIAFTSARSCDGGAGATYVLLRLRPVTKRLRKRARKPSA